MNVDPNDGFKCNKKLSIYSRVGTIQLLRHPWMNRFPGSDGRRFYTIDGGNGMNRIQKHIIVTLIALALVTVPCATCFAQGHGKNAAVKAGEMTGDALVVRPLGLCATVIGTALFVISLPFSALGGNTDKAFNYLMKSPAKFTFDRPLGLF
jgi:hypothetical protein